MKSTLGTMKSIQTTHWVTLLIIFLMFLSALGGLNYWKARSIIAENITKESAMQLADQNLSDDFAISSYAVLPDEPFTGKVKLSEIGRGIQADDLYRPQCQISVVTDIGLKWLRITLDKDLFAIGFFGEPPLITMPTDSPYQYRNEVVMAVTGGKMIVTTGEKSEIVDHVYMFGGSGVPLSALALRAKVDAWVTD